MIKWGIIGAGNIANRFATALAQVENASLYAVACRTVEKAERFQANHPSEKAYGDYQALLDDPEIDAVYVAVPHKYHQEWVSKALQAKVAVLCEKPAAMTQAEVDGMIELSHKEGVFFMEAQKSRFVPAYLDLKARIEQGLIGEIKHITTSLCHVFNEATSTYHFEPGQGGTLLDMGVYNLSVLEDFMPSPMEVTAIDYALHANGIELYVNATLEAGGISGVIESAFDRETETVAVIEGSQGSIRIPNFHRASEYTMITQDGTHEQVEVGYDHDDFYSEIQHVVTCLAEGRIESPIMTHQASSNIARLVDQLKAAIK